MWYFGVNALQADQMPNPQQSCPQILNLNMGALMFEIGFWGLLETKGNTFPNTPSPIVAYETPFEMPGPVVTVGHSAGCAAVLVPGILEARLRV